jgi:hypothetical protein
MRARSSGCWHEILRRGPWLHGRSAHAARTYLADMARFGTLADLQSFAGSLADLAPASRNRTPVGLPTVRIRLAERILTEAACTAS